MESIPMGILPSPPCPTDTWQAFRLTKLCKEPSNSFQSRSNVPLIPSNDELWFSFPSSSPEIVPSWFAWYHRVWSISEANWSSSKFNVSTRATACWTELIWFCRQVQKVGLLELITRNEDDDAILNDWITWWWQIWIVGGPFINRPPLPGFVVFLYDGCLLF